MKNWWKKLMLTAACIMTAAWIGPMTAQAANYQKATNLQWTDDFGVKFTNPNSEALSAQVYVKNNTTNEPAEHKDFYDRTFPAGENTISGSELQELFKQSGDYYFKINLIKGADQSGTSDASATKAYTAIPQLPEITVESFHVDANQIAHVKVSELPGFTLGTEYDFYYELYWKDVRLDDCPRNCAGTTCEHLKMPDNDHRIKITARSKDTSAYRDRILWISINGSQDQAEEEESSSGGGCNHEYEWRTEVEASATEDAMEVYACIHCGQIKEYMKAANSAYAQFNKDAITAIDKADANGTVALETTMWVSFCEPVIDALKARGDVTLVVDYFYKGTWYSMTIPAGADLSVLEDSEGYYGFRYLDGFFPAQVK